MERYLSVDADQYFDQIRRLEKQAKKNNPVAIHALATAAKDNACARVIFNKLEIKKIPAKAGI